MTDFYDEREVRKRAARNEDNDRRLIAMAKEAYRHSPRVKKIFDEQGVVPSDIASADDLEKLPVLSREDVVRMEQEDPPYGGFARSDADVDRIFISPGPVYEPHLTEGTLWARGYWAAGVRQADVVINTFSYHMVAAGLTFHEGLRRCGATVVPSGTSSAEMQVQLLRDLGVTAYTGTPSYLMKILTTAEEKRVDVKTECSLKRAIFVAEPLTRPMRRVFEETYGIDTYQMYGATEVGDIAYECPTKEGWHIVEDTIVEIIDPETGKRVEPGTIGEIVVTKMNNIFFLFRFGTGDLGRVIEEPCPCGRTSVRIAGIEGRVGEAVKIRGLFVAPSQLQGIADEMPGCPFQLVVTRDNYRDRVAIRMVGSDGDAKKMKELFRSYCTLTADAIERVDSIDGRKHIVDCRTWSQ